MLIDSNMFRATAPSVSSINRLLRSRGVKDATTADDTSPRDKMEKRDEAKSALEKTQKSPLLSPANRSATNAFSIDSLLGIAADTDTKGLFMFTVVCNTR